MIDSEEAEGFVGELDWVVVPSEPNQLLLTLDSGHSEKQLSRDCRKLRAVLPGTRVIGRGWDVGGGGLEPHQVLITNVEFPGKWDELTVSKINNRLGNLTDRPVISVDMGPELYVVTVALAYMPTRGELHCLLDHIEGLVRVVYAEPRDVYGGHVLKLLMPLIKHESQLPGLQQEIADLLNFA